MIRASLALAAIITTAEAADMRYCSLWSREYVRVGVAVSPDPDVRTADTGYLKFLLARAYAKCLNTEADAITLPDIPESSDDAWTEAIHKLMVEDIGTEPATADPDKPDWIAACRTEYRTFHEDDGTVIRRGSRKRVPCPHKPT